MSEGLFTLASLFWLFLIAFFFQDYFNGNPGG